MRVEFQSRNHTNVRRYGNIKDMAQNLRGDGQKLKAVDYFAASGISGAAQYTLTSDSMLTSVQRYSYGLLHQSYLGH